MIKILPSTAILLVHAMIVLCPLSTKAQTTEGKKVFTRQDSLRGSITPERAWWDVVRYSLFVQPDFNTKTIKGEITITYRALKNSAEGIRMQIDLQEPMRIDKVIGNDGQPARLANNTSGSVSTNEQRVPRTLVFKRDGNVYYIEDAPRKNKLDSITIQFSGSPRIAVNPPWDGGWIFTKDTKGRPWMTVACQGLGASVWYPCKDHQSDEPDEGAIIKMKVPDDLIAVANGRLAARKKEQGGTVWTWKVVNPINNYNIVPYIGKYVHWSDSYTGEGKRKLSLDYWVLDYSLAKSKKQFGRDVKPMLSSFEYWFGPYPFYEDGFKLIETPHLGMEHQSAIAYGNHYSDGYLGMDLSGTGWGKKWDYIIIHESGHEWFANNITTNDIADMWVHEGFTMYSEVLFVESQYGKKAASEYCRGLRKNIENDRPLIGTYGVNYEGSGDMYNKGANLLHTIRQVIDNDALFRNILRGLNKDFRHKTVDSRDVEQYISKQSGKDLSKIFDQYLRTTKIPELEYKIANGQLSFRWVNVVPGFAMPVRIAGTDQWLRPTTEWQEKLLAPSLVGSVAFDDNFYITVKKVD
ncbi:MAG TPA: M1 family metallopeptidase [Chitinophagaceae bacterium]